MEIQSTEFEKLKYKRILQLKKDKAFATKLLNENKLFKKQNKASWANLTVENNIRAIKNIIREINLELKNENLLDHYCKGLSPDFLINAFFGPEFIFIARISEYAVPGSITYDINWLKYLTIGERNDISTGVKDPSILAKNWGVIVKYISKEILEMNKLASFSQYPALILEAIRLAKDGSFIASNLMLITITESIIRVFAKKILILQNPNMPPEQANKYVDDFQSLEYVINKPAWKRDKEISIFEVVTKYGSTHDLEVTLVSEKVSRSTIANRKLKILIENYLEKLIYVSKQSGEINDDKIRSLLQPYINSIEELSGELLSESDKQVKISLKTELHFLIRRFKEDRNELMHGNFGGFNEKWKNYIYLSAIDKIFDIIKDYTHIYPKLKSMEVF